jgi:hypothetical protein
MGGRVSGFELEFWMRLIVNREVVDGSVPDLVVVFGGGVSRCRARAYTKECGAKEWLVG